uniref:CID domain-containing protein n=1 Tax=Zonotrichia albicollis TaxID=44394 RepID=A0A8D2M7C0_ZONAL
MNCYKGRKNTLCLYLRAREALICKHLAPSLKENKVRTPNSTLHEARTAQRRPETVSLVPRPPCDKRTPQKSQSLCKLPILLSSHAQSGRSPSAIFFWLINKYKLSFCFFLFIFFPFSAKSSRKLTFLYLANDVIQNSKRKGPEFTREFESVLVDAFSHVAREADEGCKKPLERLLNIWQERSVYGSEFIQQLKLSMEDSNSPQTKVAEEKKSLKRTFQQIQEEEDDDYPGSYSPPDPSAGPLLVCGMG